MTLVRLAAVGLPLGPKSSWATIGQLNCSAADREGAFVALAPPVIVVVGPAEGAAGPDRPARSARCHLVLLHQLAGGGQLCAFRQRLGANLRT